MLDFISGAVLAVWYKNKGPQRPVYEWMEKDDPDDDKVINYTEDNSEEEETKGLTGQTRLRGQ